MADDGSGAARVRVRSDDVAAAEIDRFIDKRYERRIAEEGNAQAQAMWLQSVKKYNALKEHARLQQELEHARCMLRSHSRTFQTLIRRWSREVRRLERELEQTEVGGTL